MLVRCLSQELKRVKHAAMATAELPNNVLAAFLGEVSVHICPEEWQSRLSCFYYFFMAVVVIRYEAKATARRALTFIVRIFVNDTIAITVWASFYFHGRTLGMSGAEPFLRLGNDLRFSLWSALPRGKNEVRRCHSRASCPHRNKRFHGRFDSGMGIAEIRC